MSTIVKFALREIVINENLNLSLHTRNEALDELIRMERQEVRDEFSSTSAVQWNASMREFRTHRSKNNRIDTIKFVRTAIGCGLSEALIIVKGIETQDGINADEIPF